MCDFSCRAQLPRPCVASPLVSIHTHPCRFLGKRSPEAGTASYVCLPCIDLVKHPRGMYSLRVPPSNWLERKPGTPTNGRRTTHTVVRSKFQIGLRLLKILRPQSTDGEFLLHSIADLEFPGHLRQRSPSKKLIKSNAKPNSTTACGPVKSIAINEGSKKFPKIPRIYHPLSAHAMPP